MDTHTKAAEAIHGEMRWAVNGVRHWTSHMHLDRHLDEVAWYHNIRNRPDLERITRGIMSPDDPLPCREVVHESN